MIYTRDEHPPPHVHIQKGGGMVVIYLGDEETPPSLREIYRLNSRDVQNALTIVENNQEAFLQRWREIHG